MSVDAEVPNTLSICGVAGSLHGLDSPIGVSSLGGSGKSRASDGGSEKSDAELHDDCL